MTELKSYRSYKPSGIEWLGDVPAHWEVRRLKRICRLAYGDSLSSEDRVDGSVPVYGSNGQVGFHSFPNTNGQCLIIGRKGSFGKVQYSSEPVFAIDTTFFIDSRYTDANIRWLYYLLGWLKLDAVSKDSAVPGLNREDAYQHIGFYPPLSEQTAIVRYLDQADERIRRYISSRERLIELLEEYRQAVIHHAVTQGLDPDVRLKPSGVEWLGDVPAHWEVRRVKQVAQIQGGFAFPADSFGNEGVPVVRMNNIRRGVLDLENVVRIPEHQCKDAFALKEGDIIYGLSGSIGATGSLGNYAIVRKGDIPAQLNQRVARFRLVMDRITGGFLVESLQTSVFYDQVLSHTTGTAQFNVSTNDIGNVALALPPVEEQRRIVRHLSITTANINASIDRARREIELLSEYRTRLIADVVTGQVDVRDAATRLPDEAETLIDAEQENRESTRYVVD